MSDQGQQRSYPSPTSAQVQAGVPFYHQNVSAAADVPISQLLSEELNRAVNQAPENHDGVMMQQQMGQGMHASNPHQQLAQDAIGHLGDRQDYDEDDEGDLSEGGTRKRKRQKTAADDKRHKNTRACDECRRKKVKCESEDGSELGMDSCLACRKSGLNCQFSRVPQKRGPSKGYISKLDERLQNVESAIREFVPQAAYKIGNPDMGDVSMYSPGHGEGVRQQPQAHAGATHDGSLDYAGSGDADSFWSAAPQAQMAAVSAPDLSALQSASLQDVDENILKDCYSIIQAMLPVLPSDPPLLRALLSQVPETSRVSFVEAMSCFVRASLPGKLALTPESLKNTAMLFSSSDNDFSAPSTARSLVSIMTCILLALSRDALGPLGGAGPSRTWLSRGIDIGNSLRINLRPDRRKLEDGSQNDTEAKLARRLFVILYIMDQWNALGNGIRPSLHSESLTLLAEDAKLLGNQCYNLARLSLVLANIVELVPDLAGIPSPTSLADISPAQKFKRTSAKLCQVVLDRVREDTQSYLANIPTLHAAFWHVQLVVTRLQEHASDAPLELAQHAARIVDLLPSLAILHAPVIHQHCGALSALTLAEVAAQLGPSAVSHQIAAFNSASAGGKDGSWEQTFKSFVAGSTANGSDEMMGLQHLADAAVGERQTPSQIVHGLMEGGWDPLKALSLGYMGLVAGLTAV